MNIIDTYISNGMQWIIVFHWIYNIFWLESILGHLIARHIFKSLKLNPRHRIRYCWLFVCVCDFLFILVLNNWHADHNGKHQRWQAILCCCFDVFFYSFFELFQIDSLVFWAKSDSKLYTVWYLRKWYINLRLAKEYELKLACEMGSATVLNCVSILELHFRRCITRNNGSTSSDRQPMWSIFINGFLQIKLG